MKMDPSRSVRSRISQLLSGATFSDVTFVIGDPPHSFHCHRLILATGSEVFQEMLFGKMAEKSDITVPDVTPKAFKTILRYLYTDEVVFEDDLNAFQTAYAAKKYLMKELFEMCETYITCEASFHIETVLLVYEKAALLDMRRVQSQCLLFVCRNAQRVLSSASLLSASSETLQDIFKLDFLQLDSEVEISRAIWMWGMRRCEEAGMKYTSENVRDVTMKLRKYIRFLSLSCNELKKTFENYPFFDESEQLAVMLSKAMPRSSKTPSNLCDVPTKRSFNNLFKMKMPTEYRYSADYGTDFSVKRMEHRVHIKIEGPGIIVVGFVLEMRVIPCYFSDDRHLDVEISACSETRTSSVSLRVRESQTVFLDDSIAVSDVGRFTFKIKAEGVKMRECSKKEFSLKINQSRVIFNFVDNTTDTILFPITEIIYLPDTFL